MPIGRQFAWTERKERLCARKHDATLAMTTLRETPPRYARNDRKYKAQHLLYNPFSLYRHTRKFLRDFRVVFPRKKADCTQSAFKAFQRLFSVRFFKGSDTSCANVTVRFLAVFHVGNFLYVYLESSSRLTVRVADVVAACLTFPANIAYSGHSNTSVLG